jgi:uncharacterized protein (TIGR02679 family)
VHVHARDLRAHAEPWVTVDEAWPYVLVCDQPRVLETLATQFGGRVPAICTLGSPEPLVVELLHRLRTSGVDVRFHGDLDWDGVAAANHLLDRCRAEPWRMGADDYRAALVPDLPPLAGRPVPARWDGELQRVMLGGGRALPAERTLDGLVAAIRAELA